MLKTDTQFGAALGELGIELAFKRMDFLDQRGDLRIQ